MKGFSNPTYINQKEKIRAAKNPKGKKSTEKYPVEVINIDEQLSRLREAIEGAVISKKFKDALRLQHLHLDPTSQKLTWYGVVVNKEIVKFEE